MSKRTTMRVVARFEGGTEIELAQIDAADGDRVMEFARCMKAAPDLLHALDDLVTMADAAIKEMQSPSMTRKHLIKAVDAAQSVIEEINGGTP